MEIIVSRTAYSHGWGSMPYKTVMGLTPQEREAIRNGAVVIMIGCPPSGGRNGTGVTIRQVYEHVSRRSGQRRFYHRLPSAEIIQAWKKIDNTD